MKPIEYLVGAIERGEVIRPPDPKQPLVINGAFLRAILIGGDVSSGGLWSGKVPCALTAAGITLNGGEAAPGIVIRPEPGSDVIDLSQLCSADGAALPPLIFRNCRIEGELNLQGSHIGALSLVDCELRRLRADGCQIDGGCELSGLRGLEDSPDAICQVRMVSARIDGSLDLRGSRLRSEKKRHKRVGHDARTFADRFALSLASSEIAGRLLLTDNFQALGGVSLYQADIRNSVRITNARLEAWYKHDCALDAAELKLGGSLIWEGERVEQSELYAAPPNWNIAGAVLFRRATIGGDLLMRDCVWRGSCVPDGLKNHDHGGIDLRLSRIGGQLRMWGHCTVARRWDVPSGLCGKPFGDGMRDETIGPALDAWKATIGGGVRLEASCVFHGAVRFNACSLQREIYLAARIRTPTTPSPVRRYHPAFDVSDARLDGYLVVVSDEIVGKMDFQRLRMIGALEIRRLTLDVTDEPARAPDQISLSVETASILDFQDLDLQGGVNIVKVAIKGWENSAVRHIVDLRGMRCDAYDDAEGQCWQDLTPSSPGPWRLRFEGLVFSRLERSDRDDVGPAGQNEIARLSAKDAVKQRVRGLRSYFENRPRRAGSPLDRVGRWLYRQFEKPRADRRAIEQFSPQIYETFAKAYLARGDIASGVGMIEARSDTQWLLRMRGVTRRWRTTAVWSFLVFAFSLVLGFALNRVFDFKLAIGLVVLVSFAPIIMVAVSWGCFKYFFGYGLKPSRALRTLAGTVLVGWCLAVLCQASLSWQEAKGVDQLSDRLLYAIDTILPVDLGQDKNFKLADGHPFLRAVFASYALVGWVVLGFAALTISGVLKRDVER